jgi:SAM-dependent methyltransferase
MSLEPSQLHTWSYFQNQAAEVFQAAHPRLEFILRAARRLARVSNPCLLNVGVGDGYLEKMACSLGWSVHSLDPDAEAANKLADQGIEATTGSIDAMPFPDSRFDFVVTSEVLEHLTEEQRQKGISEIKRTLKSGGYLIGTVPYQEDLRLGVDVCPKCRHVFHRWGHTTAFGLATVRDMVSPYLEVVSCRPTAFVDFRSRSFSGKVKGIARLILANFGAAIAVPTVFFVAKKP